MHASQADEHGLVGHLELAEDGVVRQAAADRAERAFAPGATAIVVSPAASTWIRATPVGCVGLARARASTPASRRPASASSANESRPTAAIIVTSAPSRAQATAWFAPLPPGHARERAAADRLARLGEPLDAHDEVEVDRADDGDPAEPRRPS